MHIHHITYHACPLQKLLCPQNAVCGRLKNKFRNSRRPVLVEKRKKPAFPDMENSSGSPVAHQTSDETSNGVETSAPEQHSEGEAAPQQSDIQTGEATAGAGRD